MTAAFSHPGVYLSETASIPHVVIPATTNLTAVLGVFPRGPAGEAVFVGSWAQFESIFGALDANSTLAAYAVWQYFQNGGVGAWIVRLTADGDVAATAQLAPLTLTATGVGSYANAPSAELPGGLGLAMGLVPSGGAASPSKTHVDFIVTSTPFVGGTTTAASTVTLEQVPAIALSATPAQVAAQITNGSQYVNATTTPGSSEALAPTAEPVLLKDGTDAIWSSTSFVKAVLTQLGSAPDSTVQPALDQIAPAVFNLLVIPDITWFTLDAQSSVFEAALAYCSSRRAFLIVDPAITIDNLGAGETTLSGFLGEAWGAEFLGENSDSAAAYYPWVGVPDPANNFSTRYVPPSGTMAGVFASTDIARGVWKAPAGILAVLAGVVSIADTTINDEVNGELNLAGINALRTFPRYGNVAWGSRTLAGADLLQSPWKYVPARRLTDFIEQSLMQSLRWAVFEPNTSALWSSLALEATAFMNGLYAVGAFAGSTAANAFSVTCDSTTTSPADQMAGVVNISVAFAPVVTAEFVVINVQLTAAS